VLPSGARVATEWPAQELPGSLKLGFGVFHLNPREPEIAKAAKATAKSFTRAVMRMAPVAVTTMPMTVPVAAVAMTVVATAHAAGVTATGANMRPLARVLALTRRLFGGRFLAILAAPALAMSATAPATAFGGRAGSRVRVTLFNILKSDYDVSGFAIFQH
jgi:hypothetical protein